MRLLREYNLTESPKLIMKAYRMIMDTGRTNFLLIDNQTQDENLRYRFNFLGIPIGDLRDDEVDKIKK